MFPRLWQPVQLTYLQLWRVSSCLRKQQTENVTTIENKLYANWLANQPHIYTQYTQHTQHTHLINLPINSRIHVSHCHPLRCPIWANKNFRWLPLIPFTYLWAVNMTMSVDKSIAVDIFISGWINDVNSNYKSNFNSICKNQKQKK